MPIIAHNDLPSFERIRLQGYEVLDPARAEQQDIRALHIGVMNMMPDAAMEATERQFLRLLAASNRIVQINIHLFSPSEIVRGSKAQQHIDRYYQPMEQVIADGLDGLVITGANPVHERLEDEAYWQSLTRIADWASENVTSTFCSCLATHGLLQYQHGVERQRLDAKIWGAYEHRVIDQQHPLTRNVNTRQEIIHSRWNTVCLEDFRAHDLPVLIHSHEVGPHLATSKDGMRFIYAQGHPEYDSSSLLKEYKREIMRYLNKEIDAYPPLPLNYISATGEAILREFQVRLQANPNEKTFAQFPEALLTETIENNWQDSARVLMSHWIGLIYQLTNRDRKIAFMDGIDPQDPLGLRTQRD